MKLLRMSWVLFPIFGSLLALLFRTSERDWRTYQVPAKTQVSRLLLPLPDGSVIRLIGVPDHTGQVAFWLGEREVSWSEARALGLEVRGDGYAASLSYQEALVFCDRLAEWSGRIVRLPTVDEWRQAARGGIQDAEAVWGFGLKNPPEGLAFAREIPKKRVGRPLGFGFRDLAGGLWEWTKDGHVIGSAWAEQNPETLHLAYTLKLPEGYQGPDVGLRVLVR